MSCFAPTFGSIEMQKRLGGECMGTEAVPSPKWSLRGTVGPKPMLGFELSKKGR